MTPCFSPEVGALVLQVIRGSRGRFTQASSRESPASRTGLSPGRLEGESSAIVGLRFPSGGGICHVPNTTRPIWDCHRTAYQLGWLKRGQWGGIYSSPISRVWV